MKSVIIAAPQSGSGKTTVTIGLMECLKRRGLKVAPFKVGPDFIDPGYHRLVCGRSSVNLDGWMCPPEFVRDTFIHHSAGADIAVIEGVMGLFDGMSGVSDHGSTAHVAKIIGSPVILVVDARSQARSAAALVKGFVDFDPRVRVGGVIFNNVAGESHARILREAMESFDTETRVLGCIYRDELFNIPSRHLGLVTAEENPLSGEFLDHVADAIRRQVDLGLLWGLANLHPRDEILPFDEAESPSLPKTQVRIAVASDAAFCFVYEDNLRLLQEAGAGIVPFSPLLDERLPDDIAGIYLPGGYPEIFAEPLAGNESMKSGIRKAVENGLPVYAECGGFMYLTRGVDGGLEGAEKFREFVGIFPVNTRMLLRRKALGYREVELVDDGLFGRKGTIARGHEFHYSETGLMPPQVDRIYRVRKSGNEIGFEGYRYNNCLASYIHLHFGSSPGLARSFVEACRRSGFKKLSPRKTQRTQRKKKTK